MKKGILLTVALFLSLGFLVALIAIQENPVATAEEEATHVKSKTMETIELRTEVDIGVQESGVFAQTSVQAQSCVLQAIRQTEQSEKMVAGEAIKRTLALADETAFQSDDGGKKEFEVVWCVVDEISEMVALQKLRKNIAKADQIDSVATHRIVREIKAIRPVKKICTMARVFSLTKQAADTYSSFI